eukprot:TRINITY_DN15585_c0_g1_i2.p1 TRINITY_DN15585_c0_g1~~TRINITY_DN15585_c0_g1_i2.p1  ORF type:complete len:268 (-),score=28.04 TRINITY_DN15585_c0_g1_i2:17-787(-)
MGASFRDEADTIGATQEDQAPLSRTYDEEEAARERTDSQSDKDACYIPLDKLPPMPSPHQWEMLKESALGSVLVLFIIAVCIGLCEAAAPETDGTVGVVRQISVVLIYLEATAAVACLLGLFFGNPGVIKRTEDTCFPIPEDVVARLRQGSRLEGFANIEDPVRQVSFCVRCLVWRPQHAHHCATCQRCVQYFDHHCGVFGRCIAGQGFNHGNMKYFKTIIGLGCLAPFTCLAVFIASMSDGTGGASGAGVSTARL